MHIVVRGRVAPPERAWPCDDQTVRRLLPDPVEPVESADAYDDPGRRGRGRPWLLVNMVASIDGATAVDGVSGGLGGPGDHQVFAALRALADVVLVGAATVRAERYGPPKRAGLRIAVVTSRAELDFASPLFTSGAAFVVAPEDGPELPVPTVRAGLGKVDLAAALPRLGGEVVLCEGGPSLNAQLLAADLVDELCVTVAPLAVAGEAKRLIHGPAMAPARFRLARVLEQDSELYLDYRRR
jgi:riboflavin biosynthesis pyrimidine reductase